MRQGMIGRKAKRLDRCRLRHGEAAGAIDGESGAGDMGIDQRLGGDDIDIARIERQRAIDENLGLS